MDNHSFNSKVVDRDSFISFLREFLEDFKSNSDKWENNKLKLFLEAMVAYSEDIDGFYRNTGQNIDPKKPSWRLFADILNGASMYE